MENRLYRSQSDRVIAGVCGGLGHYFDVDPTIIRLLFILFAFAGGSAIIVYLVLWLLMPEESDSSRISPIKEADERIQEGANEIKSSIQRTMHSSMKGKRFVGGLLIVFGAILLLQQYIPQLSFRYIWPAILIVLGGWFLFTSFSTDGRNTKKHTKEDEDNEDNNGKEEY